MKNDRVQAAINKTQNSNRDAGTAQHLLRDNVKELQQPVRFEPFLQAPKTDTLQPQ